MKKTILKKIMVAISMLFYLATIFLLSMIVSIFVANAHEEDPAVTCDPCKVSKEQRTCVLKECKPKVVYKTKTVIKEVPVDKVVEREVIVEKEVIKEVIVKEEIDPRRHSLSFLAGRSYTDLDHSRVSKSLHKVYTEKEFDMGLMYQYDFNRQIRGSVIGTVNGSALLGVGINFK